MAFLRDTFTRTVVDGWGTPDEGPDWAVVSGAGLWSVSDGRGHHVSDNANRRLSVAVDPTALRARFAFSLSAPPSDGSVSVGIDHSLHSGTTGGTDVMVTPSGVFLRHEAFLPQETVVPGLVLDADEVLQVEVEVTGTSPRRYRTRVWRDGQTVPDWQFDTLMDTTPRADTRLAVTRVSSNAITVSFDDFLLSDATIVPEIIPATPIPTLRDALLAARIRPVARLTFLSDLDTVVAAFPFEGESELLKGSVGMDRAADLHRTGNVSVVNDDGTFTPDDDALVTDYRLIRLERGAYVNGVPVYEPLMTGLVIEPTDAIGSSVVSFAVWSRLHLADEQFRAPITFPSGTRLRSVTRTLCEIAGLGTNDEWYLLDDGGATLSAPRSYDTSETVLPSMVTLARDHGLELYDDGYGRIILRPVPDPMSLPVAWEFPFAAGSRLTAHRRKRRRRGKSYNRQVVEGIAPDRYPITAEARVLNPLSPLYNPLDGSGPLGDRPAPPYVSADIHTQGQANAVARLMLRQHALTEKVADSSSVPLPGMVEDRMVVTFDGVRHFIDQLTMPLTLGEMSMTTRAVESLDA